MLKVAHVFKSLNAGGVEKWLSDVAIKNNDEKLFELSFLLQSKEHGFFEDSIPSSSVSIYKKDMTTSRFSYYYDLYKKIKRESYDVVHSHVHHSSAIVLLIAFLAGTKIRVAHCHNDKREEYKKVSFSKKMYYFFCKILISLFANRRIAVSDNAKISLFPNSKAKILPCGLNLSVSETERDPHNATKTVIGHIGSFSRQKNHRFIIELAAYLNEEFPNQFEFNLVGGGESLEEIKELVKAKGLTSTVLFLGLRSDIKNLVLNKFSKVILPSFHEGLAMVALEAQYYGKPLILSS
ncbi:glycosyltransferase, partial [Vibrio lentus]